MSNLLSGIGFGLTLSIMIGPIFFALVQAAIEKGFRAGAMVGFGVWISDLFYILVVYFGISHIASLASNEGFKLYTGLLGSVILILFGIGSIARTNKEYNKVEDIILPPTWFSLWLKGFLINTINPFTIFFWIGVISTILIKDQSNENNNWVFLSGIFSTIIVTDLSKVVLAKTLRMYLNSGSLKLLKYISGIALICFGVGLFIRVVL
ncbi:MAG: LysE family transporter [Saprospiraceae bacterium]|jgi:threonine/homoserine/homoserine lactone efflux protein|nr:LysE family transporter [Saprospiraceae bacterium]